MNQPKDGDLKVWWIPQLGMEGRFEVDVKTPEEGKLILDTLANYDQFQYENSVKGDYANAGGLIVFEEDSDGDGTPDWCDWIGETL